ncbi:MAG: hypothetical protein D6707_08865 [Bacteroidetes bacterium]|nr:MAG: hypothetical protein D6707_08865 [Bacteroidota bacterium]
MLEAPLLAFILAYLVRYYNTDIHNTIGYIFRENSNLVAYMFMAVVVALFVGMTVSAEEIIRDQKIRKRESFLNLSKLSYLSSKILIMFTISAIQMFTFVVIGNWILGIKDMYFAYWFLLFTTACFANMLGLNVSNTFNSVVTIYISIPFLLIPQLLLSGVIVKFDKLNPSITSQKHVPIVGELMTSRWAFEALAVYQFKNNKFEQNFYEYDKDLSIAGFRKNFWLSEMRKKLGIIENNLNGKKDEKEISDALLLLKNEIEKEELHTPKIKFEYKDFLTPEKIDKKTIQALKKHFQLLNKYYIKKYNRALDKKDETIVALQKDLGKEAFNKLKDEYENDNLSDLLRNRSEINKIIEVDHELIQRTDPVFLDPDHFRAHFYAPRKLFMNRYYETYWFNNLIVWIFSIILMFTLYFDTFKHMLDGIGKLFERISPPKR